MLREYTELSFEEICRRALAINMTKSPIRASPTIVDEACITEPPCRHCKWEYFKTCGIQKGRRHSLEESLDWVRRLQAQGIQRTFLASGWMGYRIPSEFLRHVEMVRQYSNLEVYGLFGALGKRSLADLQNAGMQGYLCSLESPSQAVYESFRPGGDSLQDRMRAIEWAAEMGLKIWSGFLVGLGETDEDVNEGIEYLRAIKPVSVSVLPFTPFPNTPMVTAPPASPYAWARAAAIATLAIPEADIFNDQAAGIYRPYADLFKPNGIYEVPRP